jgi:hypothetical protein
MNLLMQHLAEGLTILDRYAGEKTHVSEHGNHLHVWNWDDTPLTVNEDARACLLALGWYENTVVWGHALSP